MDLRKLAIDELQNTNLTNSNLKDYANSSVKDFCYRNIPNGYEIDFMYIEDEETHEIRAEIIDRKKEYIRDENREINGEEECFIVESLESDDKFLVPLFEIEDKLDKFTKDNLNNFIDLERYIDDNFSHLKNLEEYDFKTNTKFAIELEGGWNGDLRLDNFSRTTDNSFRIDGKDRNDEFVYNGCNRAEKVVKDLLSNYAKLRQKDFEYKRDCGTHIHFSQFGDSKGFDRLEFLKLTTFLINIEEIILDFIPVYRVGTIDRFNGSINSNEGGYSKSVYHRENKFLSTLQEIKYRLDNNQISGKNIDRYLDKIMKSWYDKHIHDKGSKYNPTRYYGINLHSYFYRGSLELRYFEGNYKNAPKYIDFVDKVMYLIENFEWDTISKLLKKLDSYSKTSTKTCALLYALGVSNLTLGKLLSRTDHTQMNIVKSHNLLNQIRERITDKPLDFEIPDDKEQDNIMDTTCYPDEIDENADYLDNKYRIIEKIKSKKEGLNELTFSDYVDEFTGQDTDEFMEFINERSEELQNTLERADV